MDKQGNRRQFAAAQRQARAIGQTKTEAGKRRAALLWCRKVLAALGEGNSKWQIR